MKKIIENLRNEIKTLAAGQVERKKAIHGLTWRPGSDSEIARIRSERAEDGRRKHGKKAIKGYRQPETGPQRHAIHMEKLAWRSDIRDLLALYGMLRGRAYKQIEAKATPGSNPCGMQSCPSARVLFGLLTAYLGDQPSPYTRDDIQAWLDGTRVSMREAA